MNHNQGGIRYFEWLKGRKNLDQVKKVLMDQDNIDVVLALVRWWNEYAIHTMTTSKYPQNQINRDAEDLVLQLGKLLSQHKEEQESAQFISDELVKKILSTFVWSITFHLNTSTMEWELTEVTSPIIPPYAIRDTINRMFKHTMEGAGYLSGLQTLLLGTEEERNIAYFKDFWSSPWYIKPPAFHYLGARAMIARSRIINIPQGGLNRERISIECLVSPFAGLFEPIVQDYSFKNVTEVLIYHAQTHVPLWPFVRGLAENIKNRPGLRRQHEDKDLKYDYGTRITDRVSGILDTVVTSVWDLDLVDSHLSLIKSKVDIKKIALGISSALDFSNFALPEDERGSRPDTTIAVDRFFKELIEDDHYWAMEPELLKDINSTDDGVSPWLNTILMAYQYIANPIQDLFAGFKMQGHDFAGIIRLNVMSRSEEEIDGIILELKEIFEDNKLKEAWEKIYILPDLHIDEQRAGSFMLSRTDIYGIVARLLHASLLIGWFYKDKGYEKRLFIEEKDLLLGFLTSCCIGLDDAHRLDSDVLLKWIDFGRSLKEKSERLNDAIVVISVWISTSKWVNISSLSRPGYIHWLASSVGSRWITLKRLNAEVEENFPKCSNLYLDVSWAKNKNYIIRAVVSPPVWSDSNDVKTPIFFMEFKQGRRSFPERFLGISSGYIDLKTKKEKMSIEEILNPGDMVNYMIDIKEIKEFVEGYEKEDISFKIARFSFREMVQKKPALFPEVMFAYTRARWLVIFKYRIKKGPDIKRYIVLAWIMGNKRMGVNQTKEDSSNIRILAEKVKEELQRQTRDWQAIFQDIQDRFLHSAFHALQGRISIIQFYTGMKGLDCHESIDLISESLKELRLLTYGIKDNTIMAITDLDLGRIAGRSIVYSILSLLENNPSKCLDDLSGKKHVLYSLQNKKRDNKNFLISLIKEGTIPKDGLDILEPLHAVFEEFNIGLGIEDRVYDRGGEFILDLSPGRRDLKIEESRILKQVPGVYLYVEPILEELFRNAWKHGGATGDTKEVFVELRIKYTNNMIKEIKFTNTTSQKSGVINSSRGLLLINFFATKLNMDLDWKWRNSKFTVTIREGR